MAQKRPYDESMASAQYEYSEAEYWNGAENDYYCYWDGQPDEHRSKISKGVGHKWVRDGYVPPDEKARAIAENETKMAELRRAIQAREEALKREAKEKQIDELRRSINQQEEKLKRGKAVLDQKQVDEKLEQQKHKERKLKIKRSFQMAFNVKEAPPEAPAPEKSVPAVSKSDVERLLKSASDYECLQVKTGECSAVIKKKFKEMARMFHPDKCKIEGAKEAFQRLNRAYGNLLRISR
ncbi:hypothetical protein BSKO_00987 [Bryopsis sp. KO-2023]|nr:hypothetical protein BSKO_00987 [Bryopsis sp. KO-2023]